MSKKADMQPETPSGGREQVCMSGCDDAVNAGEV